MDTILVYFDSNGVKGAAGMVFQSGNATDLAGNAYTPVFNPFSQAVQSNGVALIEQVSYQGGPAYMVTAITGQTFTHTTIYQYQRSDGAASFEYMLSMNPAFGGGWVPTAVGKNVTSATNLVPVYQFHKTNGSETFYAYSIGQSSPPGIGFILDSPSVFNSVTPHDGIPYITYYQFTRSDDPGERFYYGPVAPAPGPGWQWFQGDPVFMVATL